MRCRFSLLLACFISIPCGSILSLSLKQASHAGKLSYMQKLHHTNHRAKFSNTSILYSKFLYNKEQKCIKENRCSYTRALRLMCNNTTLFIYCVSCIKYQHQLTLIFKTGEVIKRQTKRMYNMSRA